jgi:hypothetical protein
MSVTAFEPLAGPLGPGFTLRIADKGGENVAGTWPKRGGVEESLSLGYNICRR